MSPITFTSKSLIKNFYNAYKAIQHNSQYKENLNKILEFPQNNDIYKYIKHIKSSIMKYELINNNFSVKFIENEILLILKNIIDKYGFEIKKEIFNSECEELINKFELKINEIIKNEFHNYECIFHVSNLKIPFDFKIGNVEFFKNTENNEYNEILEDFEYSDAFSKINDTYAKITIYGSKEYAQQKAETKIKIAINILKLFLPEHFCNFNLDGDVNVSEDRPYILKSTEKTYFNRKMIKSFYSCEPTIEEMNKIDMDLFHISSIFKNEDRSEFENKLLTAVYWFGESLSIITHAFDNKINNKYSKNLDNIEYFDVYPKLLNLIIALETVFVFDEDTKSDAISKKTAKLIAKPEYEDAIEKFIETIYDNRSKIVHSGTIYISENDLDRIIYYTRLSILELIHIDIEFQDKIRYFNKYC